MYKIEKIILDGYKRLKLGQIGHIEINFNARDQIIIGTNGSGKTSIFHELSALPADKAQFEKTGKKEIHIRKDGKSIVATSLFNPKPFHSFMVDGVEMNESGLVTIQTELAEKYTGVTQEIQDLLIGKILFTSMKGDVRRQWFTRLSDANIEYLIGVYVRFKDELSVISGGLKLAKRKLVAETSKAIKDDELNVIRKDVEGLYHLIEYLAERRIPLDTNLDDLKSDRKRLLEYIDNLTESVAKAFRYIGKSDFNPETIQEELNAVSSDIRVCKIRESEFFEKHKEQSEVFEILERTKLESVAKLSSDIEFGRKTISKLKENKTFSKNVHYNPEEAIKTINSIFADIQEITTNIEANPGKGVFNRTTLEILMNKISNSENAIRELYLNRDRLQVLYDHRKDHVDEGTLTCPKCAHSWTRGLTAENIANIEKAMKEVLIKIEESEAAHKLLLEERERFKVYSDYMKSFRSIVSHTGIISDFWNKITEDDLFDQSPRAIGTLLVSYKDDLSIDIEIRKNDEEVIEKLKLLELTTENKDKDYEAVKRDLEELNNKIHENNVNLTLAYNKHEEMTKFNNAVMLLESRKKAIEEAINDLNTNTANVFENQRREAFNAILRDLQSILASKERILHESVNQINMIKDLENEIGELTEKEKALKVGLKVLSPTEGLIAKGLYGFMQVFIRNMNAVIAKIWSYPFIIKPCNTGDEGSIDLTYKFPMVVNGVEGDHKDVSEGSSAMLEVVDIAFRICALKALKMGDSPLFLDEFGKTMDSVHRRATTNLINNLMEEDSFTQMFLISHDISQYGALSNCEICVLDSQNVIVPSNTSVNKHVVMY